MKKGLVVLVLVLGFVFLGCVSTSPVFYSASSGTDFIILGEVTFRTSGGGQTGWTSFLEEARRQFPGTDFVIDVMVDHRETRFLFWRFHGFTYRGTAIQYVR